MVYAEVDVNLSVVRKFRSMYIFGCLSLQDHNKLLPSVACSVAGKIDQGMSSGHYSGVTLQQTARQPILIRPSLPDSQALSHCPATPWLVYTHINLVANKGPAAKRYDVRKTSLM